ncbi:hypothetical protein GE061_019238 [Apolygus lucorum]|uniref:Ciliary microtubule inner protein 2A-C-like domain-containing protein n=1 Tax=Apolygus lucorum TaxID=248454 RepID=A0A8S9X9T7_APOLU|nr:hypothetical protein GE061_019238 [Apolygus lucorum]
MPGDIHRGLVLEDANSPLEAIKVQDREIRIVTPQPHYIPGYTGHVPGYTYKLGDTYGSLTHKILLDPTTTHSEKLVLSDRTVTDFEVTRPTKDVIDLVDGRKQTRDAKYAHPMVPAYAGFVPMLRGKSGMTYTVAAEEGVAEFEKNQMKKREAEQQLERIVGIQSGKWEPTVEESQLVKTEFTLPLLEVRPEASGVLRNITVSEPKPSGTGDSTSPYFMEVLNPQKNFIPGYTGHIPFGQSKYGKGYTPYTNSALCDFTTNYRRRLSTEWAPVSVIRRDPPLLIQPTEIYHKHVGMLPDYGGHVPGSKFRVGKTFGTRKTSTRYLINGEPSGHLLSADRSRGAAGVSQWRRAAARIRSGGPSPPLSGETRQFQLCVERLVTSCVRDSRLPAPPRDRYRSPVPVDPSSFTGYELRWMVPSTAAHHKSIIQIYIDWGNHYLEKARSRKMLTDLQTDLVDGLLLADLIEAVTNHKVPDVHRKPKTAAMMFLESNNGVVDGLMWEMKLLFQVMLARFGAIGGSKIFVDWTSCPHVRWKSAFRPNGVESSVRDRCFITWSRDGKKVDIRLLCPDENVTFGRNSSRARQRPDTRSAQSLQLETAVEMCRADDIGNPFQGTMSTSSSHLWAGRVSAGVYSFHVLDERS